ncbi:MAG: hypothetical protein GY847_11880 [Proteobacteria bacterium]|nr:hypothetical protein [Pseudomonadota bacterium]
MTTADRIRSTAPLRRFFFAYFISLTIGILQLAIAHVGGLNQNGIAEGSPAGRLWVGYVSTFHWSASYITVVPLMAGCGVVAVGELYRLSRLPGSGRLIFAVTAVFALCTAGTLVGTEVYRSMYSTPDRYCQWNYLTCQLAAVQLSSASRKVLYALGYAHYFTAYFFGFFGGFGVAIHVFMTARIVRDKKARISTVTRDLLLCQRVILGAYLFYLVMLRSSKTQIYLLLEGNPLPAVSGVWQFLKGADSYIATIAQNNLWRTLAMGGIWLIITYLTHCAGYAFNEIHSDKPHGVNYLVDVQAGGYNLLGANFVAFAGFCLIGIALPPPTASHLVVLGVLLCSAAVIKSTWNSKQEPPTS